MSVGTVGKGQKQSNDRSNLAAIAILLPQEHWDICLNEKNESYLPQWRQLNKHLPESYDVYAFLGLIACFERRFSSSVCSPA